MNASKLEHAMPRRTARRFFQAIVFFMTLALIGGIRPLALCSAIEAEPANSLLLWRPGSEPAPPVSVMADAFNRSDLGLDGEGLGGFWPFASVVDFFAGQDPDLCAKFAKDFQKYLHQNSGSYHPACPVPDKAGFSLYTYRKPYECHQAEFLAWLKENRGLDDFIEPAGRRWNDYRGNLRCPLVVGPDNVTDEVLKQTFGHVAWVDDGAVTMLGDNQYNPLAWVAPINEIHHHEQASQAVVFRAAPGQWERAAEVFAEYHRGNREQRICLAYDIAIEVTDQRKALGEWSIWDYYGRQPLSSPCGLLGQTHWNAFRYSTGEIAFGQEMPFPQRRNLQRWMEVRMEDINIQIAIMVNFLERDGKYRLAEFMLASKNQRPIGFQPLAADGDGIVYSADPSLNRFFVDGGLSGPVGWWRVPVSMLSHPLFTSGHEDLMPVVMEGGEFSPIPDGGIQKRYKGKIDLTKFYAVARQRRIFPGQRGYASGTWIGFEGDAVESQDPNERHGIEWLGAIYEAHGPFEVKMTVHELDVHIATASANR